MSKEPTARWSPHWWAIAVPFLLVLAAILLSPYTWGVIVGLLHEIK